MGKVLFKSKTTNKMYCSPCNPATKQNKCARWAPFWNPTFWLILFPFPKAAKGLQGRGSRTVENHLVSLWQLWKREENCSLLEWSDTIIITIILVIIFIVMILNMIKSQSRPWSSSPKWWEWSATGRGTAKASEGHKSVQLQNLSFLSGRCHPLLLPNFPKCLIHITARYFSVLWM